MKNAAIASQFVFIAAGLWLLWQHFLAPAARARRAPPRLAAWNASLPEVLTYFFYGCCGGFLASFLFGVLAKAADLKGDALAIAGTAGMHFGALVALAAFLQSRPADRPALRNGANVVASGLATFLVAMPFVFAANAVSVGVFKLLGLEPERQPAIEMVGRIATSPWMPLFVVSAIVIAPITEELLFRAGLFRALRTRQPRWVALVIPSLLFAAIHFHLPTYLPLATLGVIFSLAYQHSGNIGTPIVAHAAFNLNNLLALLAGVDA